MNVTRSKESACDIGSVTCYDGSLPGLPTRRSAGRTLHRQLISSNHRQLCSDHLGTREILVSLSSTMSDNPVYNPPVPYSAHFHSGIKSGTLVIISGDVLPSAERFSMNFQCGSTENDDIAFHFNPRFDEGLVLCNTREGNIWGKKEVKPEVPFQKGQPFEIQIQFTSNEYRVSVGGRHFLGYNHRIALPRVNTLVIMGGIKLTKIDIQPQGVGFHHHYFPRGQMQNSVPFSSSFHNGVSDGSVVAVRGEVQPLADRFSVDFRCGSADEDDIAFHFNPRFDEGLVLCNTRESNNWGNKEVNREVPFKREHAFEIRVLITNHGYNVSVNGHHYLGYNHRILLQRVNTLAVMDCVALSNVEIQAQGGGCHHHYFQDGKLQKSVPFSSDFLRGVSDGSVVTVRGAVLPAADMFAVNFQCAGAEVDDIAFHFNPRLNEGLVVCNTKEQENWGEEEQKSEMPFQRGQLFEIQVLITKCEYKVSVNGRQLLEYYHRIPLHRISTLAIKGDIKLTSVEIHTPGGGC